MYAEIEPFVELFDDVAPFQEIRTISSIPLRYAVWLLTTERRGDPLRPYVPGLGNFKQRYGPISASYWHRSHQMDLLGEWQYVRMRKDADGRLVDFQFTGEHYWQQNVTQVRKLSVALPAHEREVEFRLVDKNKAENISGPWHFIDVARILFAGLRELTGKDVNSILPHRLIREFGE